MHNFSLFNIVRLINLVIFVNLHIPEQFKLD
jgi:hypothetical protein